MIIYVNMFNLIVNGVALKSVYVYALNSLHGSVISFPRNLSHCVVQYFTLI